MKRILYAVIAAALFCCLTTAQAAGPYTLITEPDQGFQSLYTFVGEATHTIDMTMYELSDTTFEQDLVAAKNKGVTVRVILDQNLEKSNNQAAYTYLTNNGVSVHWANTTYHATHQKTITIDGAYSDAQTAIMTLNLTPQYYSTTRDFAVIETDPNDIAAIETTFNADFQNATVTPPVGDDLVWSPTNSQTQLLNIINSAKHTLQVENEEMSDTAIVSALESAAERGVDVEICMTNTSNDYETEFNALVAAGADVSTYVSTASLYIHAKVVLADYGTSTAQVFVGSENFSSDSLTSNRELGLIINDSATMNSLDTTLTSDFDGATPWPGSGTSANYTLTASPTSVTVAQGATGTSTITVNPDNGFTGSVALTASGLPTGVTASFSPSSTTSTSTLTLTASSTATTGTATVTITGTSGSLTHTTTVSLTVNAAAQASFSLAASPTSLSVAQSSSGTSAITVTAANGFTGSVALTASGLPTGVTAAFSPTSVSGSGTSTLTFTVSSTATAGTYTITVTGTSGSLTHTATISLTVTATASPNFTVAASPTSVSVAQSATATSAVTVGAQNGFTGTVALSASGLPTGVTAAFSPASITTGGISTLTFTASSAATAGTSTITVTGTSGSLTHTATISLTVTSSGGTITQLLGNPGFETGTASPWVTTSALGTYPIISKSSSEPPHSGTWDAWLCGYGKTDTDTLAQTVAIPSGKTTATLTFWLHIDTAETSKTKAYDTLKVQVRNSSGTVLATLATYSNLNAASGYTQKTFSLSSYIGQTIQVYLVGSEDSEDQTSFVTDDFALNVQ